MEELRYYEPRKLTRRQLEAIITLGNLAACGAETDFDRAIGTAKQLLADAAIVHGTYAGSSLCSGRSGRRRLETTLHSTTREAGAKETVHIPSANTDLLAAPRRGLSEARSARKTSAPLG